jgi:hypothetical protein
MPHLDHFVTLAIKGSITPCSDGEHCAFILASELADKACRLDLQASAGLVEFMRWAAKNPTKARDMVASWSQPG